MLGRHSKAPAQPDQAVKKHDDDLPGQPGRVTMGRKALAIALAFDLTLSLTVGVIPLRTRHRPLRPL